MPSLRALVIAASLLTTGTPLLDAEESDRASETESAVGLGTIFRLQSPEIISPPQYSLPQAIPYCPPTVQATPCPPTAVCVPAMDAYATSPAVMCTQWRTACIGAFGEFLYLQPKNADVTYAVPQNGFLIPGAAPVGPVASINPSYSPGFRAGGFFGLGPESRIVATYSWFRSSNDSSVTADGTNVINPLVLFPGTFNAGFSAQQASAHYAVNFQLIDLDYQVMGENTNYFWWSYSVGGRYARLTQNFSASYPFAPPDGTTTLNTDANFTGGGPKAGMEGERILFQGWGLRAYGKGSASFLVGRFSPSYLQTNQFFGTQVNTSLRQDRIVPVLDFELGLAWLSPGEHLRLSAGYLVSAWFNTITTPAWIDSVQNASFQPGSNTLTFDGLTARGEVRF